MDSVANLGSGGDGPLWWRGASTLIYQSGMPLQAAVTVAGSRKQPRDPMFKKILL